MRIFRTPNCLMTLMTHDIRDTHNVVSGSMFHVPCGCAWILNLETSKKNFLVYIRKPQSPYRTFAPETSKTAAPSLIPPRRKYTHSRSTKHILATSTHNLIPSSQSHSIQKHNLVPQYMPSFQKMRKLTSKSPPLHSPKRHRPGDVLHRVGEVGHLFTEVVRNNTAVFKLRESNDLLLSGFIRHHGFLVAVRHSSHHGEKVFSSWRDPFLIAIGMFLCSRKSKPSLSSLYHNWIAIKWFKFRKSAN